MEIFMQRVDDHAIFPDRQHTTDAGWDLATPDNVVIPPGETVVVDTHLRIGLPDGYEGQVRMRSSVGKKGVAIPNGIGTIDSGYRGTIKVIMHNLLTHSHAYFRRGDRIAQLVIKEIPKINLIEGDVPIDTDRGEGGLGSTGR